MCTCLLLQALNSLCSYWLNPIMDICMNLLSTMVPSSHTNIIETEKEVLYKSFNAYIKHDFFTLAEVRSVKRRERE